MADQLAGTMRRDIFTAYLATGSRVLAWVIVSAIVFRHCSPEVFAALVFVRATVGLLNYTTMGLTPAVIHFLAKARVGGSSRGGANQPAPVDSPVQPAIAEIYVSAVHMAKWAFVAAIVFTAVFFVGISQLPAARGGVNASESLLWEYRSLIAFMGLATAIRLISEPPAALLQTFGKISVDNLILAGGEWLWALLSWGWMREQDESAARVAACFLLASIAVFAARLAFSFRLIPSAQRRGEGTMRMQLLNFGLLVVLAQAADYLYAPTDYWLINLLLQPETIAVYAPAIQIDAGLLVLVTGLAAVLLPNTALAHAKGDLRTIRQYYVRATLASGAMLLVASGIILAIAPNLFRIWLGRDLPDTRAILPLILIHTIIGGSSAAGRSILLGMGRVKPFTVAAIISGVVNVICSYCFVRFLHLGLRGIVLGTIVAVVGRCAIWMPWYVLRTIRHQTGPLSEIIVEPEPSPAAGLS